MSPPRWQYRVLQLDDALIENFDPKSIERQLDAADREGREVVSTTAPGVASLMVALLRRPR